MLAALYLFVGMRGMRYPPEYLLLPVVWAMLALVASVLCAATAMWQHRRHTAWAGAIVVFVAFARSAALVVQNVVGPTGEPAQSSRWIAAMLWATLAVVVWVCWEHVITRWVAMNRVAPNRTRGDR